MRVLVFDTETTGLPKSRIISPNTLIQFPHIVQFSYIIYDTSLNIICDSVDNIIKLKDNISIPVESTNIHNITNEISKTNGKTIEKVFDEFFYHLKNIDLIVGHNIEFDINIIRVELLRLICNNATECNETECNETECNETECNETEKRKQQLFTICNFKNIFCTLQETIDFCNIQAIDKFGRPYKKFPKLIELHNKLFDETPKNLHNSMIDILITLRCFMKIKYDIDILTNCRSFKRFVRRFQIY